MCTDCGCLVPVTGHGDPGHLVLADIQRAASASGLPLLEAAWNIPRTLTAATQEGGDWPPGGNPLTGRPTLVWDVDGILAFAAEAMVVALNARFGTTYSPITQAFFPGTERFDRLPDTQAAWIAGEIAQPAFMASLAPDFRAIDTLRDACEAGFECVVATARPPQLAEVTEQWLHDWGAPPVEVNAVGHNNKSAFMAQRFGESRPAVLIDDNVLTWLTIARPGIQVWSPQRPYTATARARSNTRLYASYAVLRYWLGLGPQSC